MDSGLRRNDMVGGDESVRSPCSIVTTGLVPVVQRKRRGGLPGHARQ